MEKEKEKERRKRRRRKMICKRRIILLIFTVINIQTIIRS